MIAKKRIAMSSQPGNEKTIARLAMLSSLVIDLLPARP
jgi:hypothetical protein